MTKKTRTEGRDFEDMKKLGFEFKSPQDEFSYQPDSGGTADGIVGKQEYGIDVDRDAEARQAEDFGRSRSVEDPSIPIPGESEWSQKQRLPAEEPERIQISIRDDELLLNVHDRLVHHPHLNHEKIAIHVKSGAVTLRGDVSTNACKLLASEIVAALPGVTDIRNELSIFHVR